MTDSKNPKLRKSRAETSEKIRSRIDRGKELLKTEPSSEEEFEKLKGETWKWTHYNKTLFNRLFDESPLPDWYGHPTAYIGLQGLNAEIRYHKTDISGWINDLESIYEQLEIYEELPNTLPPTVSNENKKIFIGHGRSHVWRELKDFIVDTLELEYEEFNRISPAGKATSDRLKEMLEVSCMAFLVMTGEDEHADNLLHARENVIHEVGLFQGRLGFERAIILLEDGCKDFSNIHGITYIPFPKGNIKAAFEDIRQVLERESMTLDVYDRKYDFDKAIQHFNKLIELNPDSAEAYYNRGTAYGRKGDFKRSIEDFNRAIALNPHYAEAYHNRGVSYIEKRYFNKATGDLDTAIQLNPAYVQAYYTRARVSLHLKEWQKAKAYLTKAKDMGYNIVEAFQNNYGSVEAFEAKNGVKLPEDIVALLQRT